MRTQAGLGSVSYPLRKDIDNGGKISLAKVVRIYEKHNSADVILLTNNFLGDNREEDGITSCYHMEQFGGWDDELQVAYGTHNPLHIGQLVVIAYVDGMKERPIILGALPPLDKSLKNTPIIDARGELEKEQHEQLTVSRYQDFKYKNGIGEFEHGHNSRAFFIGRKDKISDHRENAFRYGDLSIRHKYSREALGLTKEQYDYKPFNYYIETKNKWEDIKATVNRFYHDAEKGITRISKDNDDRIFYMEIAEDNSFRIRMQRDSYRRKKSPSEPDSYPHKTLRESDHYDLYPKEKRNDIPPFRPINHISEMEMEPDGSMVFTHQANGKVTKIRIDDSGVDVKTTEPINIESKASIHMMAPHINIVEQMPSFEAESLIEKDDENEWECEWTEPTETYGT